MGAFVSILFIVLSAIFLLSKILTLYNDSQTTLTNTLAEKVIPYTQKFTGEEDFFVAAALTAYDSEAEHPEDLHRYGELVFSHYGWSAGDDIGEWEIPIQSYSCSEEELGLIQG